MRNLPNDMQLIQDTTFSCNHDWASTQESCASCSLGVRIYDKMASLFHLPRARKTESSKPAFCCRGCCSDSEAMTGKVRPTPLIARLTSDIKCCFVRGCPAADWKNGPSEEPLLLIFDNAADHQFVLQTHPLPCPIGLTLIFSNELLVTAGLICCQLLCHPRLDAQWDQRMI